MSHFSTFYTSMNKEPVLVEALELLGHVVEQDQELTVTGQHGIEHETVTAELAIGKDIGFRFNLAIIALQANYTFSKYPTATLGIGISVR